MIERYFVTGTDTEIGKTIASIALLQAARLSGFVTAGYKPVASSGKITAEGIRRNSDVLDLQYNSSVMLTYEEVNIYTFTEPTSPHIVSFYEKKPISFKELSDGLHVLEKKANWILVEGAGGWFTPLTDKKTFADWVIIERFPVILVVGIKLGCINHALLTAMAIRKAGLHLAGWIANNITIPERRHKEYLETLKKMLFTPFLGNIPFLENIKKNRSLSEYINLKHLTHD